MGRILVLYHSITGCVEKMAPLVAEGAKKIPGTQVRVKNCEEATAEDVKWCDGMAVGTPTNLGGIAWRMKKWWDDFAAENWDKVDGKLATVFSSQGGHGGGAEIACQAMMSTLLNFGFLTFGVTDYVTKINTLHYGACIAKAPRNEVDKDVCRQLGLRLAEWVAVFVDGRKGLHPLLTTKAAPEVPGQAPTREKVQVYPTEDGPATRTPVYVVVVKQVPEDKQAEWLKMAEELSMGTWREAGCLQYSFVRSSETKDRFIITEQWSSREALEDHFKTEHFTRLVPAMDAISETVSLDICNDALARKQDQTRPEALPGKRKKQVLIYTKALDYVHGSLPSAAAFFAMKCRELGYEPVVSDNAELLEKPNAPKFDSIVFVNNSGELFEPSKAILQEHIDEGRGVLGVHACLASFLDGEDATGATKLGATTTIIQDVFGTHFEMHPPLQKGTVLVDKEAAKKFGFGLESLPESFEHEDEFFNFSQNPTGVEGLEVLATVDESSYEGGTMGKTHPVVWRRALGPKSAPIFYTALGHSSEFYNGQCPKDYLARIMVAGLKYVVENSASI